MSVLDKGAIALLIGLSLSLSACGKNDEDVAYQTCVDENDVRVDDSLCPTGNTNYYGGHAYYPLFLSRGSSVPPLGGYFSRSSALSSGMATSAPVGGSTYARAATSGAASSILRGGFGSTASSFSSSHSSGGYGGGHAGGGSSS